MPDASRRTYIVLGAILALFICAVVQPANALESARGGFGGVQGWGGLYRDNHDPGYFPAYVAYDDAIVVERIHPRRHDQFNRHDLRHNLRHHSAARHCAPRRPVRHCVCR